MDLRWRYDDMCKIGENCQNESCWKCQFPIEYDSNEYIIVDSDDEIWESLKCDRCKSCGKYDCNEDECEKYINLNNLTNDLIDAIDLNCQNELKRQNETKIIPKNHKKTKYKPFYEFGSSFVSKNKI